MEHVRQKKRKQMNCGWFVLMFLRCKIQIGATLAEYNFDLLIGNCYTVVLRHRFLTASLLVFFLLLFYLNARYKQTNSCRLAIHTVPHWMTVTRVICIIVTIGCQIWMHACEWACMCMCAYMYFSIRRLYTKVIDTQAFITRLSSNIIK